MYSWRVPTNHGYGGAGAGGKCRMEIQNHLGPFQVSQDQTWHTIN